MLPDRETYLSHLRREPDCALKMFVFDLRGSITVFQGAAAILCEALQSPEAAAVEDIEMLRKLTDMLLQNAANAQVMIDAASDFAREQTEQRLAQNKKDMGEE